MIPPQHALAAALAGGHHILLEAPAGSGKTRLALALGATLGVIEARDALRAPHHTASLRALIGTVERPGEASLADGTLLFLDEATEFPRTHLDALREPLAEGRVRLANSKAIVTRPAAFQLIAGSARCPLALCPPQGTGAQCAPAHHARHLERLASLIPYIGFVFDARDIATLNDAPPGEAMREAVASARARARGRWGALAEHGAPRPDHAPANAHPSTADLRARIAWSLADLDGARCPQAAHLRTAHALAHARERRLRARATRPCASTAARDTET